MSKSTTTVHSTGTGEILFMSAARAFTNQKTGKSEFSIKVKLQDSDSAVSHLKTIAEYKVDTKTNRALKGTGTTVITFASDYAPKVFGSDGVELTGKDIPYFDGRKDTGTATVSYKVIDFGNNKIVRLSGITLNSLTIAPKGAEQSLDSLMDTLNSI